MTNPYEDQSRPDAAFGHQPGQPYGQQAYGQQPYGQQSYEQQYGPAGQYIQPTAYSQPSGVQPYGSGSQYAASPQPYGYPPAAPSAGTNGLGVAGFVTGLLGLIFCWVPWMGILLAIVGVILSGAGMSQGKKRGQSTGLAIAGLVCGIIALIPAVIIMVAYFAALSSIGG